MSMPRFHVSEPNELREKLARIRITLKADVRNIEKLMEDLLRAGSSAGLKVERRAEGYALMPSHEAAVIGLPHLRIARIGDLLMIWIRAPYSLDERRCRAVGLDVENLYQALLTGAKRIAEILRRRFGEDELIQISLP